jgi:hypothetical protein
VKTPFLGGTYIGRAKELVYNRAINIYPELVETKEGKAVGAMYGCPGLILMATAGSGPIRGAYAASSGILYVVSGNTLYSVSNTWVAKSLGTLSTSLGPVNMVDNGKHLLVVDGVAGWCLVFNSGAFTNVLPASVGVFPLALAYQDGFALVNYVGSNQFYQSNLNDFTTWQTLNFSSADSTPSQIVTMFDLHREVWLFKQDRAEVWINAGTNNFAFQRLQGVQIPQGCAAPYSIGRLQDSLVWLGLDEQGSGVVYLSEGYRASRISTHSIEYAVGQFGTISDAIGFVYQTSGHYFYVLTFPTGNQTFCYDLTTKLWHERAYFSNGSFSRHRACCHAFAYGKHVVGDYQSGNLYAFDDNTYTDNGQVRKWLRSWRAMPPDQQVFTPMRFNSLQIDCQTGINIPDGTNPQFMLRWSDDGGYTWSNESWSDGNQPGSTFSRVMFRRMGTTKRSGGLDRIFELSGTDPVPVAIVDADLDAEQT